MKRPVDTILLLSGGLDSAVALFELAISGHSVVSVYVEHGQAMGEFRRIAMGQVKEAKKISKAMWSTDERTMKLETVRISDLWRGSNTRRLTEEYGMSDGTMLGRNLVYLAIASTFAARYQAEDIVMAVHLEDDTPDTEAPVYPDQSEDFMEAARDAISQGIGVEFSVTSNVWGCSKADLFDAAHYIGVLKTVLKTVSCMSYHISGKLDMTKHEWGRGCGTCESCQIRSHGWELFKVRNEERGVDIWENQT